MNIEYHSWEELRGPKKWIVGGGEYHAGRKYSHHSAYERFGVVGRWYAEGHVPEKRTPQHYCYLTKKEGCGTVLYTLHCTPVYHTESGQQNVAAPIIKRRAEQSALFISDKPPQSSTLALSCRLRLAPQFLGRCSVSHIIAPSSRVCHEETPSLLFISPDLTPPDQRDFTTS